MSAPRSAVQKAVAKIQNEAEEMDNRRRLQLKNQADAITRLLKQDGASYTAEMELLHIELADTQAKCVDAMLEVKRLRDKYEPEGGNSDG